MKSKSLKSSMLVIYITSICIPFLLISTIFSYYFSIQTLNNNKTNLSNTLESISSGIGIYVAELNSISNVPYYISSVQETMEDINSGNYPDILNSTQALRDSKNFRLVFLKYIYNATQNISDVTFIPEINNQNRIYLMSRNANETRIITNNGYQKESWYTFLQAHKMQPNFFPLFGEEEHVSSDNYTKKLVYFSYAKIIRDVDTKKNIGIIKIDIPANNITKLIDHVQLASLSSIAIADEDGNIIYLNSHDKYLSNLKSINKLPKLSFLQYQVIKTQVDNTRFQLIYLSAKRNILYYQIITYLVVFLFTTISIFISFFIYRYKADKISRSVSKIKETFERIETGDLTAKCSLSGQQEFIEISHALNHMTDTLNEYIINEYKASLSQQEAEFRALQAQINPHFLYNTLNGFIALNRMGEKRLLEKSIIQLTHLFQYTCNNTMDTSIQSELSFIQQYLELQSLKYDERLSFYIYMEPETEKFPIPKLLIQPLIENSIIHGLEPLDKPMQIKIETALVESPSFGKYLFIHVQDNGQGFDIYTLETHQNIGLKNIENRLTYQNPKNVFQIRSKKDIGTECIILIKINE